jgi:UDP-N-acetylmuramoylalanine--D-glutamate ligase
LNLPESYEGMKVTIMGLGLHGGGIASARFFLSRGADVTITDLRDESILRPSLEQLSAWNFRQVFGRHERSDFSHAEIVIKNPAVPITSPYLQEAKVVETDISIFLRHNRRPIIAVTGTKGKSTVVSAIHHAALMRFPEAKLGGNITVSPLTFLDEAAIPGEAPVILELSSWQLADLAGKELLKPAVAVITNIMHDHQDRYSNMEAYVADKRIIYSRQEHTDWTVVNGEDGWGEQFAGESRGRIFRFYGNRKERPSDRELPAAWLNGDGEGLFCGGAESPEELVVPKETAVHGSHNRLNLLIAASALRLFGMAPEEISRRTATFSGIPHRLELVDDTCGIRWFNDSAATIPEATASAVKGFREPLILITGGTDKELDYGPYLACASIPREIFLLDGSATDILTGLLKKAGIPFHGPYRSLKQAVLDAADLARPGDVVLFSPGATSFGMFLNEFDRGNQFRKLVLESI